MGRNDFYLFRRELAVICQQIVEIRPLRREPFLLGQKAFEREDFSKAVESALPAFIKFG